MIAMNPEKRTECICMQCGKPFTEYKTEIIRGRGKFCNKSCTSKYTIAKKPPDQKGANNSQYKGGRYLNNGYVFILSPDHPSNRGSYVPEHRLIMEHMIGRHLRNDDVVHHINGIKDDNREENLLLVTNSEHSLLHWRLKRSGLNIYELMHEVLRSITINILEQIRGVNDDSCLGLVTSNTDLYATPQAFVNTLKKEFHFHFDVCVIPENTICENYFSPDIDGL